MDFGFCCFGWMAAVSIEQRFLCIAQMTPGLSAGNHSRPLMPTMLCPVVNKFQQRQATSGNGGLPEEQDAQEFLLYLLEQIELELLRLKDAHLGRAGES